MKTIFVGAVEGSAVALNAICQAGHIPDLVVTLPPESAGAHSDFADLVPIAQRFGSDIHLTTRSDSAETLALMQDYAPDLIMVIGWSQLCGPRFRALPRLGCLGFHPSALPRLRGRGVIPWHILQGETQGGASLFWLDDGADTGEIAAQRVFALDPETETAASLYAKAVGALSAMLPPLLAELKRGNRPSRPQDEDQASFCARRRPEDGLINWHDRADHIDRLIRATGPPYPGAYSFDTRGNRLVFLHSRMTPRRGYYIGLPGQIQAINDQVMTIMCGDGHCIDVTQWQGDKMPALHSKLGHNNAAF